MADPILIHGPDLGINGLLQENLLDPRSASKFSQNMLYERGLARTAYGFAKLNLTTTGLASGEPVLGIFQWNEIDGYSHLMAVTKSKIYENDRTNSTWTDKTQSGLTMVGSEYKPVSWIAFGHDDTDVYLNEDGATNTYHHVVVCNGGGSSIQRWAGRFETDFADLKGGLDYHGADTHRALKVDTFKTRAILLSPQYYDSASRIWVENNNRIQYSALGKLETWNGTGAGFVDLMETGGHNIWGAQLANQYIVYQERSVWGLNYTGGTTIFDPVVLIRDLGLLAPHLMVAKGNIHYFVGNDLNVYAYYGGSMYQSIGDKIHNYLIDELAYTKVFKCWMIMETYEPRLWIFIVTEGNEYITKAYGYNLVTGSWTVRDFSNLYGTGEGITSVALVGATSYQVGETYTDALNNAEVYKYSDNTATSADCTAERYGYTLLSNLPADVTPSNVFTANSDWSNTSWCAGGLELYTNCAAANYRQDFSQNWLMAVFDGSKYGDGENVKWGTHFYTITDVTAKRAWIAPRDSSRAICTSSTLKPAAGSVCWYPYNPDGATYKEGIQDIQTQDMLLYGDATGYVYDTSLGLDGDSTALRLSYHVTPIFDGGDIDIKKRWPAIFFTASGESILVEYRVDNFDTSESGWTEIR